MRHCLVGNNRNGISAFLRSPYQLYTSLADPAASADLFHLAEMGVHLVPPKKTLP